MRVCILVTTALSLLLLAVPAGGQDPTKPKYEISFDPRLVRGPYERPGDGKLVYDVPFQVKQLGAGAGAEGGQDAVVILENGREAHREPLRRARAKDLTTVLAMDVSGSMARESKSGKSKMEEARAAAHLFLNKLHAKADTGLILFDHAVKLSEPPAGDPARFAAHRRRVGELIDSATPDGGTAYLDAVFDALQMLRKVRGNRAVVLMTDGVDINSRRKAADVVAEARRLGIPVHVLGVGDPGWDEPVSTVLVLDHSASMSARAGESDRKTKMGALKEAAFRFVELMRPSARATLLPFSSSVEVPGPFTADQRALMRSIRELRPAGGTSLYDATLEGIETVVAARPKGRRYVVALTDGVDEDPGSRHDPDEVIARAREAGVTLFMLGLGRKEEVNEKVMRRMAEGTGGKYFHAENQKKLFEIFESLSLDIHGDGIDEAALKRLAADTKGKYYRAADASELSLIYEGLAEELQSGYTVTFPSLNQKNDGTVSAIDLKVVDPSGKEVSNVAQADVGRHGLVVPEVDYRVYLALLALLLGLLYLPAGVRRLSRPA